MARLITIYWRDIPSRLVARRGRESVRHTLPARFQKAVNRAALKAGKGSSQDYLDDWKRVTESCGEDLDAEIAAKSAIFDRDYDDARLEKLAKARGIDPESSIDP